MTNKAREEIVQAACRSVEFYDNFSCDVIATYDRKLAKEYRKFMGTSWPWKSAFPLRVHNQNEDCDTQSTRILFMLLFLEARTSL